MERSFYNEEFEELIKEKADQYKMYPSEKVWVSIYRSLHSGRKWYWFSFVLFLAGVSYYAIEELAVPSSRKSIADNRETLSFKVQPAEPADIVPFTAVPASGKVFTGFTAPRKQQAPVVSLYPDQQTSGFSFSNPDEGSILDYLPGVNENEQQSVIPGIESLSMLTPSTGSSLIHPGVIASAVVRVVPFPQLNEETGLKTEAGQVVSDEASNSPKINWLQENAVYELTPPKRSRFAWQLSFSPTMNYRKLLGNSNASVGSDAKSIPIARNIQGDIDHLVNHKPAVGFEVGSFVLYKVNRNLTVKGGFQFNYSQYDIQAYGSYSSEVATIALNNFVGFNPDSITNLTRIRNFGGNERKDLRNQYFQLSAPVGVEFLIFGNRRIQFAVAGTLQPTYLMNRNSYLITTDYRNYTREPSLVRRWNVNTSAEAFIAYNAYGLKWQIGPQFRYQLLSSYSNKYPIKEYLMEYGVKLGISKTIH